MKQYTKDELQTMVTEISKEVSNTNIENPNTGNSNEDAAEMLINVIVQVQRNCESIIVEILDKILND